MVFFFIILFVFVLITIFIIFANIKVEIKNLELNTEMKDIKKSNVKVIIRLELFSKSFINYSINMSKFNKMQIGKNKIKLEDNDKKKIMNRFKKANIGLDKLDLYIIVGLDDCVLTSYAVGVLSTIISIILPYVYNPKRNLKNYNYKVKPIYNKFFSKLQLNCIISAKLVHIIFIILLIWKGSRKYERTPHRKSYGYSYE